MTRPRITARDDELIAGTEGMWELVIGLEIHAQLKSNAKLFSTASTIFGADPNTQVAYLDAGMPGTLPVPNRFCVAQAMRAALGLGARVETRSVFERKNYFYPDLPLGYQISQYAHPLAREGRMRLDVEGRAVEIGIERVHMEQDAGKSLHDVSDDSLVDLNRAGVALIEIVSHPDIRSARQAQAYVRKMRQILRYLDVCDGNMEEGSLRADVNLSLCRPGAAFGTRTETKNVNSIRFIGQAIAFETERQIGILEEGGEINQETRLFDPTSGETRTMRSKEDAHDYRYFPDPDLRPLVIQKHEIAAMQDALPELPDARKARFVSAYGLSAYEADVLTAERAHADFFEIVAKDRDPKRAAHVITGDYFAMLNKTGTDIANAPIGADALRELLKLMETDVISGRIAKDVFEKMCITGQNPAEIVAKHGLQQVKDINAITRMVEGVIAQNPEKARQAKDKPKLLGWFVGQVMKASQGKANPQSVNEVLRKKLGI